MRMLVRQDPVAREMAAWRNAFDRMFNEVLESTFPYLTARPTCWYLPVDVVETDEAFIIKASLAGAQPDSFDISLTDNVLTIRAEVPESKEFDEAQYHVRERRFGTYERSLTLPTPVNADAIKAEYVDGVLTVHVPKAEEVKPKRIPVRVRSN